MFKKIVIGLLASVLAFTMVLPVSASSETTTLLFQSTEGTVKEWHTESTKNLTSPTLTNICGGDMGMWFYTPSIGLQDSFAKVTSRKAYIECYEYDGTSSADDLARKYTATFATANGIYAPKTFSVTYTNSNGIEGHAGLELYMKYKVTAHDDDTSTTVRAGIFNYLYWVY